MPGIGEVIDGAMQQAPQPSRQGIGAPLADSMVGRTFVVFGADRMSR
jgi:hypothetical protein